MASSREVSIGNVQLGRSLSADKRVSGATEKFSTRDTIYASVETSGSAPNTTVNARWTYNGQQVVKEDSRTISPTGSDVTEFHITKPSGWPKGKYQFTVTVNGSTQSRDFEVK
jgi:archaellum component FlaF (FlaF/FlaG flagellin family)